MVPSTTTPMFSRNICGGTPLDFTCTMPVDQSHSIDRQHGDGDAVGGDDEIPAAGNHASVHTASPSCSPIALVRIGGGAISVSRRSEAMRARSMMKPTITKRMPNAFARSGIQNGFETVFGFD